MSLHGNLLGPEPTRLPVDPAVAELAAGADPAKVAAARQSRARSGLLARRSRPTRSCRAEPRRGSAAPERRNARHQSAAGPPVRSRTKPRRPLVPNFKSFMSVAFREEEDDRETYPGSCVNRLNTRRAAAQIGAGVRT